MSYETEHFGMALRLARVKVDKRQKDIAYHMGWHSTAVSQLERGDRAKAPEPDVVQRLDDYLDADGALMEAAGYQVIPGHPKQVVRTFVLPDDLSDAEFDILNDAVALILKIRGL